METFRKHRYTNIAILEIQFVIISLPQCQAMNSRKENMHREQQYFRNMYVIRLLLISFAFCYILFNVAFLHFKSKTSLHGVNTYCWEGYWDGL